jgi:hypothetical protein
MALHNHPKERRHSRLLQVQNRIHPKERRHNRLPQVQNRIHPKERRHNRLLQVQNRIRLLQDDQLSVQAYHAVG